MKIVFGSPEANAIAHRDRLLLTELPEADESEIRTYLVKGTALVCSPDGDETQDAHIDLEEVAYGRDEREALSEALLQIGVSRHDEWNGKISPI